MTPTSPLTYEDFISQVEGAMLPDFPFRVTSAGNQFSFSVADNANSYFKFEDIEVGKIYVFWEAVDELGHTNHLWFMTPYDIQNEYDYSVYWGYYTERRGEMVGMSKKGYRADGWDAKVWSGKRWKVLENNIFNAFMNWINENPFEVKQ